jgi:hypothetical protein
MSSSSNIQKSRSSSSAGADQIKEVKESSIEILKTLEVLISA